MAEGVGAGPVAAATAVAYETEFCGGTVFCAEDVLAEVILLFCSFCACFFMNTRERHC